eukprot:Clim_evm38s153 gene=Clim_evmTU38s153
MPPKRRPSEAKAVASATNGKDNVHVQQYQRICQNLMSDIESYLLKGPQDTTTLHSIMAGFTQLKRVARSTTHENQEHASKADQVKGNSEALHLQLQNLQYEKLHILKEIHRCKSYVGDYKSIELETVDEFLKRAPENLRPTGIEKDEHHLTVNRLAWELQERQRMSALVESLHKEERDLEGEITTKRTDLAKVQPDLQRLADAAAPLQKSLGVPVNQMLGRSEEAKYLPGPLYILYAQACTHRDTFDDTITVSVAGDIDRAKLIRHKTLPSQADILAQLQATAKAGTKAVEGSGDAMDEDEDDDEAEETQPRKKSRKSRGVDDDEDDETSPAKSKSGERKSEAVTNQQLLQEVIQAHPLAVQLQIPLFKDEGKKSPVLTLSFHYTPCLEILSVETSLSGTGLDDLLLKRPADEFLLCLFPEDTGLTSPNPLNDTLLEALGVKGHLQEYIVNQSRPFRWAQWLGALEFLSLPTSAKTTRVSLSRHQLARIIDFVRYRARARRQLVEDVKALQMHRITVPARMDNTSVQEVFPLPAKAKLSAFRQLSVIPESVTDRFASSDITSCYEFTFTREKLSLRGMVVVLIDHPLQPPCFIGLQLVGDVHTREERGDLENALSAEVNGHFKDFMPEFEDRVAALSLQMRRLQMCFDIFFSLDREESDCKRLSVRTAYGRTRARPFAWDPTLGRFLQRP